MAVRDPHALMWQEAFNLLEQAERLRRQFFEIAPPRHGGPMWQPPIDLFETETEFRVFVALPGVREKHLEVMLAQNVLVVAGGRSMPPHGRSATIRRVEIPHGRFERRIELPPGRYELGRRELAHGCLALEIKKLR